MSTAEKCDIFRGTSRSSSRKTSLKTNAPAPFSIDSLLARGADKSRYATPSNVEPLKTPASSSINNVVNSILSQRAMLSLGPAANLLYTNANTPLDAALSKRFHAKAISTM